MITQFSIRILFMKYSHLLSTIIQLIQLNLLLIPSSIYVSSWSVGSATRSQVQILTAHLLSALWLQVGYIILFCLLLLSCKVVIILLSSPRTLMQLNHLLHTKCFEECMHYRKPRLFGRSINQQQQRTWCCFRHSTSYFII